MSKSPADVPRSARSAMVFRCAAAVCARPVGEVLSIIRDLAADGMTMIIVTHEMGFACEVGDALVLMDHGVVALSG